MEYFENGLLKQVTNYDTLNREISLYDFTPLEVGSDKQRCIVRVSKYLKNTPIPILQTTYFFVISNGNTFFESSSMGNKRIGVFDSTKNVVKFRFQDMLWDEKNNANGFSIDSLLKLKIKYKKDYSNDKIEYKYDKDFNITNSKIESNGRVNYLANSTYDAKKRLIFRSAEETFDETDTTYKVNNLVIVKENKVFKVRYSDENRTSEGLYETYRRKKLYAKKLFKWYYNEYGKILLLEEYEYEIEKGVPKGLPNLIETESCEYSNKLPVKITRKYLKTNQIQIRELKYTFW